MVDEPDNRLIFETLRKIQAGQVELRNAWRTCGRTPAPSKTKSFRCARSWASSSRPTRGGKPITSISPHGLTASSAALPTTTTPRPTSEMPKLFTVQQDIGQLREAYRLAPCPFCASYDVAVVRRTRIIRCGNCHVEVRPPAWCRMTEAEAALWRRPANFDQDGSYSRTRRPALSGIGQDSFLSWLQTAARCSVPVDRVA
jgi:hypothetical protein